MEDLPSPFVLVGAACAALLVMALVVRTVVRALRRREFQSRAPMDTNAFVAAIPQAGRDREHRRLALAVRAAVAAHARVDEKCVYPTDLIRLLGSVRGPFSIHSLRRGMEQQLGKKVVTKATGALAPAPNQTLAAFINQVARGAEIVE